ncbi:hypothetical protein [Rhizobium sp. LjRoot254]|uniref:hypothetical protein n=1 Tax=Rhizobium sp. LjRoot254 TaxID=3342297 RepID=UPI003ED0F42C
MAYMPTANETGTGIRRELAGGEDVFIARGLLVSSSDNYAILSTGGFSAINVQGTVSALHSAIRLGDDPAGNPGNSVLVGRDGCVASLGQNYAIDLQGTLARITIRGEVWGSNFGISMGGDSETDESVLVNSGSIRAEWTAVRRTGDEDFVLRNSGEIVGGFEGDSFWSDGASQDRIINTGIMSGNIGLGAGNDILDSREGLVEGFVEGRGGADQLLLGAGGLGNDTLRGGAGADSFIFDSPLDGAPNVDRILDFNVRDDTIELGNIAFQAMGLGSLGRANFAAGASGKALDADDRIIYDRDSGWLLHDADGKGGGDAVHFATIGKNLNLDHRDFLVFDQAPSLAERSWEV